MPAASAPPRLLVTRLAVVGVAALLLGACNIQFSNDAEARDQWKRSYTLAPNGTFELHEPNGKIDVTVGDGNAIEVEAERIVRAGTEAAAKTRSTAWK